MADSYNFSITPGEDWTVVFLGYTGAWTVTLSGIADGRHLDPDLSRRHDGRTSCTTRAPPPCSARWRP
jgi:hypothetical protein